MIQPIVSSLEPITLVGAGHVSSDDLQSATALAPRLIAVDGGADAALQQGFKPDAVIGDFDSLSDWARAEIPATAQHHVTEQDSTDFEKALRRVKAPVVLGVGFLGKRFDHQLAAMHALLAHADRVIVLISDYELILHCPPRLSLTVTKEATVSLFPLIPVQGRSTGLRWPIDGLEFEAGRQIGTSNQAAEPEIEIAMQGRGMIAMLPRVCLPQLVQQVLSSGQSAPWPVRE